MTSADEWIVEKVNKFLADVRKTRHVKDITIEDYRYVLLHDLKWMKENGLNHSPSTITKKDIDFLMVNRWNGSDSYNHGRHSLFFRYLKHFGNAAVRECRPPRTPVARPNADWLTDNEAVAMYTPVRHLWKGSLFTGS